MGAANKLHRRSVQGFADRESNPCSLQIAREGQFRELWIMPATIGGQNNIDAFCRFTVVEERRQATVADARSNEPNHGHPVHLAIHTCFLGVTYYRPDRVDQTRGINIEDNVSSELARGILSMLEAGQTFASLTSWVVGMLCSRLQDKLDRPGGVFRRGFDSWQIVELAAVLSGQIEEAAPIASVAARCRLSVCQFSRIFKAAYGMPLHKYILNARVKRAQSRLTNTDDTVSQIALDCGFSDQSSFTRRFTAMSGIPPGRWRRRFRKSDARAPLQEELTLDYRLGARGDS